MKSEAFGNTDIKFRGFLYLNAMENEIFSDEELESIFDKAPVSYDFLKDHENIRQASKFKSNLKAIYSSYRDINYSQSLCIKALIEGNFNQQEEIQEMFLFQIALNRLKKGKYPNNDNLVKIIKEETEKLNKEAKEMISSANKTAETIVKEAKEEGEEIKQELIEEGRQQTKQMMENAQRDIEQQKDKMYEEMHDEMVTAALSATEKLLETKLDGKKEKENIDSFIKEVINS